MTPWIPKANPEPDRSSLMLPYEEALARLLGNIAPNPVQPELVASMVAPGVPWRPRWLGADVFAPTALPPFDNAAVDGYAVRASDTPSRDGRPAILRLVGESAAGTAAPPPVGPGEATRIFTGAPLPPGANAVVMQEDCDADHDGTVAILEAAKPWEGVRLLGEDVKAGEAVGRAGDLVTPQRLALLMAAGTWEVPLHGAPTVALLGTGSELVPAGACGLAPGQVHESNLGPLAWLAEGAGARVTEARVLPDDPRQIRDALEAAAGRAQVILTAGGASVGDHDHLRAVAVEAGFRIDLWKLALKPGKPFFAGQRDGTLLLGVPGNPVSAFVTTVLLVLPALRQLAGCPQPAPATRPGILAAPLSNPDARRHFIRVRIDADGWVHPTGPQASHMLASMAASNALVDVPPMTTLAADTGVRVIVW